MSHSARRVIVAPRGQVYAAAAQQVARLMDERDSLRRELTEVRRSRDEVLAALRDLRIATEARERAEAKVRTAQRDVEIGRARAMRRDPACTLH